MNNLESFATSYNRKTELAILEQLTLIIDAKKAYLTCRNQFHESYQFEAGKLNKQIIEQKAYLDVLRHEKQTKLKMAKEELRIYLAELTENKKLDVKEIKQHKKLILSKIEANYHRKLKEMTDESEIDKFKIAYKEYLLKQEALLNDEEERALQSCLEAFNGKKQLLLTMHEQKILEITNYYQAKADNGLSRIEEEKAQRLAEIANLKQEIKNLKTKQIEDEANNKNNVLALKSNYLQVKEASQLRIKEIKAEAKAYYQTLSEAEQVAYRQNEVYVKENFKSLRKQKIDAFEKRAFKKINPAYLYILPAVFGALFFTILPFIFMIVTAFFRLDLATLANSRFMGFRNFINIFTRDIEFQKALGNTAIYSLCTVVLLTVVTIGMAAWLAKNTRIHNVAQTMIFTPHIASLVSISILWIAMLNPQGIINQILAVFGIEGPGWLVQENTSLLSVSFVTVWKDIGYYVLIIVAGLQAIPPYIYEAAKLDKSSKRNTFFKLTLPLLVPTLSFVFVTKFINSFKVFAPIEIMTNGGPMGSSMVLSYWIYKVGRIGYNYGQAMAGAIVLTIIIAACTFVNYRFFRKKVTY